MSKTKEESILNAIIKSTVKASGESEDRIEELSSYMITYINTGAQYGMSAEGFVRWYIEQGKDF